MINIKELRSAIQTMDRHSPIYRVLRDELTLKGYWRKKPRGNPRAGYAKMKEKSVG
jgi:hypothetical protein